MGIINTGKFAKALYPGLSTIFGQSYKEKDKQYTNLYEQRTSTRNFEEGIGVSGFGLAVLKTEGNGISYDTAQQGYINRFTHKTYALGTTITEEMIEDNLYDLSVVGKKDVKALAFSMAQSMEVLAADPYIKAFSGGGITYGDGLELCVSNHPNIAGGTFSNIPSVAVDISEAALEQAYIDISDFRNDRGLRIKVMPQTLIVPKSTMFEIERILKTELRYDTANNDMNALKAMGIYKNVVVNHYLTDSGEWFIRTDCPDGMVMYTRRPVAFAMDNDFDTSNAKFKASFRVSFGVYDVRGIYGCPGG